MSAIVYHIIMNIGSGLIKLLTKIMSTIGNVTASLARLVAPELAKYNETLYEQLYELDELKLMQEMLKLQAKAIDNEDWDEDLYNQMNHFATILVNKHDWSKQDLDNYIGKLVESGPEGYTYEPSGEEFE